MESTTLVESGYADPTSSATPLPDTGLLCLVMLARFHGIATEPDQLAHEFADGSNAFTKTEILLAAKKLSLKAKAVSSSLPGLTHQCLYFEQPHTFEQILLIQTAEPALVGHA